MPAATTKQDGVLFSGVKMFITQVFKPTGATTHSTRTGQMGRQQRATAEWSRRRPLWPDATEMIKTDIRYNEYPLNRQYETLYYAYDYYGKRESMCALHPPLTGPCSVSSVTMTQAQADSFAEAAFTKAVGRQTGEFINLGETFGSARETALMVAKRTKQFANFLRHLNARNEAGVVSSLATKKPSPNFKKKVRDAMRNSRSAADAFLELKFGWLQLMKDIYDAIGLRGKSLQNGQIYRGRSGLLSPKLPEGKSGPSSEMPVLGGKGGYYARIYNGRLANLNAVGLANPVLTAWELTPLSFVADWFLPVSNLLAVLSAFSGMSMYGGWVVGVSGTVWSTSQYGWYFYTSTAIRRPVGYHVEVLSPGVPLPMRDVAGKVLVSAALIRQRLGDTAKSSRSW